jgi:hypothetical protein
MPGLLMVLTDPPAGNECAYHDWYNQHAAARLRVPGITSARRYRAVIGEPAYMADYELDDVAVLNSPEYTDLHANRPSGETEILASLPSPPDRRVYNAEEEFVADDWDPAAATVAVAVWMTVEDRDDFARWYSEEHVPLLFKVPGWMRTRRYALVSGGGPTHLALHDLSRIEAVDDPVGAPARNTAWRDRVIAHRTAYERRVYTLVKKL